MKKEVFIYSLLSVVILIVLNATKYSLFIGLTSLEIYVSVGAIVLMAVGFILGYRIFNKNDHNSSTNTTLEVNRECNSIGLTKRELEVLELMAQGYTNQEIANQLFVSLPTIKSHASNLYEKMDVKRRTQAVQKALDLGLIAVPT